MEFPLSLSLWSLVIEVFHSSSNQSKKPKEKVQGDMLRKHTNIQTKNPIQHDDLELCNVDYFSANEKSSQFGAMLYIFEDKEAVIKMTIKGRSPTMRQVSRTHRVALDWLFDRINLDPKIHIKYVDTRWQTKGYFTRDELNNLLHLCNTSHFSSASCPRKMAKRMQLGHEEERIVAKSKPTLNLVSKTEASSSTVQCRVLKSCNKMQKGRE